MKKLISILLALVLCLSAFAALAEEVDSPEPVYPTPIIRTATPTPEPEITPTPNPDATVTPTPAPDIIILNPDDEFVGELLQKLKESSSVDDFFGPVIIIDGTKHLLSELLGSEDLTVNEFLGISYEGPADRMVRVAFTVPSVYAEGERVYVVIGIVEEETEEVVWYAFEGNVEKVDGDKNQVVVELTPELFQEMLDKECVVAIVSVAK